MTSGQRLGGGSTVGPQSIKLYGLLSHFSLPDSPYKINYISTFVNPQRNDGHAELLDELLPMRERLPARKIKQLGSLLQRNLNDFRVANELIPYLQGKKSQVHEEGQPEDPRF